MKDSTMRQKSAVALAFVLGVMLGGCLTGDSVTAGLPDVLKSHVSYLASDSLQGRLVGTPGIEEAGRFIAQEFEDIGLLPAFEGSYYQRFEIEFGFEIEATPTLRIGDAALGHTTQFAVLPLSGSAAGAGPVVVSSGGLPPDHEDISGSVVFVTEDAAIEKERWTLIGHDGLLDWMRDMSVLAAGRGVEAIVFVTGPSDEPGGSLHTFATTRAYRPLGIPCFEITHAAFDDALAGDGGSTPTCEFAVTTRARKVDVANVAGSLAGAGGGGRWLVVGAHYDHLGYGDIASSTPWRRQVHNGADDNASGVAALIEIARKAMESERPRHSIAFVCFTAEELGAVGSEYYCEHMPQTIDSTLAMINLDTVGRLEENRLIVFGARSASELSDLLQRANAGHSLDLIEKEEIYGFSDQNPFYARGIPSLHFFTGAYDDYHSPDDDWQNINFEGLGEITSFVADFAMVIASTAEGLTPVIEVEEPSEATMPRGHGAFLGIIPDFTYNGTGVGIKGTVPKSPAETAGLDDGDVILAIDGEPIADLRGLMRFLVGKSPGDEIEIRVIRGSSAVTKKALLSVRSPREQGD